MLHHEPPKAVIHSLDADPSTQTRLADEPPSGVVRHAPSKVDWRGSREPVEPSRGCRELLGEESRVDE